MRLDFGQIQSTANMGLPVLVRETNERLGKVKRAYNQSVGRQHWVTEFGAVGNGAVDETAAFQTAVNQGGFVYVPNGTYLLDEVSITTGVHIFLSPDAILKQRSAPASDTSIFKFTNGSDFSSVYGGQFDGNASTHSGAYTDELWTAIYVLNGVDHIHVEGCYIHDFMNAGFYHASGSSCTYSKVHVQDCGKAFVYQNGNYGALHAITGEGIQNRGKAIFQHAAIIRDSDDLEVSGIRIIDFDPDTSGLEPTPTAIAFERLDHLHARNLVASGYTTGGDPGRGFTFDSLKHSSVYGFSVSGGYEQAYVANTCEDSTIGGFECDLQYSDDGGGGIGARFRAGALYDAIDGSDTGTNARANADCRNLTVHDGNIIGAASWGYGVQSGGIKFINCRAVGAGSIGWHVDEDLPNSLFVNAPTPVAEQITFDGCEALYCGAEGLNIEEGSHISIVGGIYSNNGQDTALANTRRVGMRIQSGAVGVTLSEVRLEDTQDWSTKTDGASFEPEGTASTTHTVTFRDPHQLNVGQHVTLKNADGSGDITGKIIDMRSDEAVVETNSVQLSATGNLTSLTGTFDTTGTSLSGSGASLDNEVTGRTWVTDGSDYRKIVRVDDADSGVLDQAFPSDLSGATLQMLTVDVDPIASQQYSVRLENGASEVRSNDIHGSGATDKWSVESGAETAFSPGSEGPLVDIASATTVTLPGLKAARITGTTQIDNFSGLEDGHEITLKFVASVTVRDQSVSTGNIYLAGASNLSAGANDVVRIMRDGSNYFQSGASDN